MRAMSRDSIAEEIRAFVAREAQVPADDPDFTPDVHLFEAGYLDSIRLVALLSFLETAFGVRLDEGALFSDDFTTIRGLAGLVAKARAGAAAPAAPCRPGNIRPFVEADLPAVAALYESVERSGTRVAAPGLADYFRRMFLAQPHADPTLPSLVYEEGGVIEAFLGVHSRRLSLDGQPVRAACAGQLVVAPRSRPKAPGTLLLQALLCGKQDLTMTDGATPEVARMWEALGVRTRAACNVRWMRMFRPAAFAARYAARRRWLAPFARLGRPLWALADVVLAPRFRAPPSPLRAEELTPARLLEGLAALRPHVRLLPAYDEEYLAWLFAELAALRSRGPLRRHLLRDGDGRLAGWYLYHLRRRDIGRVLQVAALPGREEAVLGHLFADAWREGALALEGRLEPRLQAPLARLGVSLRHAWSWAVASARDPALAAALFGGDALLTRLEGEWWCDFQHEALAASPRPPAAAPRPAGAVASRP